MADPHPVGGDSKIISSNNSLSSECQETYIVEVSDFRPQAEIMVDAASSGVHETQGVVTYIEDKRVTRIEVPTVSPFGDVTTDTSIQQFFSRPVRTVSFSWLESDIVGPKTIYAIWGDWVSNAAVKNKLNNYAYMKGDLKIKVQISASPFYYGMLQCSYLPLPSMKPDTIAFIGNKWLIPMSQRPKFNIEPQKGDTYTMTLPFIYPANMLNVQDASAFIGMGNLRFDIYSMLQSANGASGTGITVTVYCWMDNIVLSGASTGFAAQSDEYGEGPVSKPASWIANIAGRLSNVPIIGPFATATRIGASAVSAIASLFGFTNVPVIEDTKPYHVEAFPKFASSEIGFPVQKLTLDPKNELSVDPRILGIDSGVDEMAIKSICMRESYLTKTTWSTADAVDAIKFTSLVTPVLYDVDAPSTAAFFTPMAQMAVLFHNWRGDIIFTFRVVHSMYHKGKLRISYDPSGQGTNNIVAQSTTNNIVHTTILDIGETSEIEFRVPYQQATQFLNAVINGPYWSTSASPAFTHDSASDNGTIMVRVQNTLTAPVASSSVDVLVYVRAADNIEFGNPEEIDYLNTASFFAPQSEDVRDVSVDSNESMGTTRTKTDLQYLVHFGERYTSLRQLLRRYEFVNTDYFATTGTVNSYRVGVKSFHRFPSSPGYCPSGYHVANKIVGVGTAPYNFVNMTMLSFFGNSFLAYRGSINWSFDVASNTPVKHMRVIKSSLPNVASGLATETTVVTSTSQMSRQSAGYSGFAGQATTNQLTESGLNIQYPMFSKYKFQLTSPIAGDVGIAADDSSSESAQLRIDYPYPATLVSDGILVSSYVAAGTDFGLYFFLNVPTLYFYTTYPTAV